MAERPNYKTVKDAKPFNPKLFNQCRGQRFQPLLNVNDRLRRHPMIFWGIIWLSIALPSSFAIGSLINPDSENSPTGIAIQNLDSNAVKPASQIATESGKLPRWVFGAVAVSCTASCFILAQHIKPVEADVSEADVSEVEISVEELIPLSQRLVQERSQHPIHFSKQSLKRLKPYERTEALPFMQPERSQQIQPSALEWVAATQQFVDSAYLPIDGVSEPVLVTEISREEPQPLDWGEARLADAMDLRRRYPLHLIANNKSQS